METAEVESTISQNSASEGEAVTEATEGTPAEEAVSGNAEEPGNEEAKEAEWSLPIRFNHEDRALSRDEAIRYSQIGLKFAESGIDLEKAKPIYDKLDYVSALKGVSPEELIDSILTDDENSYREGLIERFGEDNETVNELIKLRRNEQKDKYNAILSSRQKEAEQKAAEREKDNKRRLADEFSALSAEFPEIKTADDIPEDVMKLAREGKDLTYAYLLHKSREERRISAEKAAAKKAAEASSGKLENSPDEEKIKTQKLINAFWGR